MAYNFDAEAKRLLSQIDDVMAGTVKTVHVEEELSRLRNGITKLEQYIEGVDNRELPDNLPEDFTQNYIEFYRNAVREHEKGIRLFNVVKTWEDKPMRNTRELEAMKEEVREAVTATKSINGAGEELMSVATNSEQKNALQHAIGE